MDEVVGEVAAAHPKASLVVRMEGGQHAQIDRARLRQALCNLIDNAVRHGASGTPVTVRGVVAAEALVISIHNDGDPIPADELDGIFSPMKPRPRDNGDSGKRPMNTPTSSLGLGLYIAERIVTAHGGQIAVTSDASAGTTFTVYLPQGGMHAAEGFLS